MNRLVLVALPVVLVAASLIALPGCNRRAKVDRSATAVALPTRAVEPVLANTIGASASISGLQPQYVSGYGIVVGLAGTGSPDAPAAVRAALIDEMTRYGVGKSDTALEDVTPDQMIDDPNTAVVLVQAVVPPAVPSGTVFDVRVETVPGSGTTSLEGGTLYTTELRRGIPLPGGPATRSVAIARGPVVINPLVDPATPEAESRGTLRTAGRILGGGVIETPFRPVLRLDTPSHTMARSIAGAINARFPQRAAPSPTARGLNEDTIEINVPPYWNHDTESFFQLVLHLRVNSAFAETWAQRYVDTMRERPELADEMAWALEAIGEAAVPFVRQLYDSPEVGPQFAALRTGARLNDPMTRPHLQRLAQTAPPNIRVDALELLAELPFDPRIDTFLTSLVDDADVSVRVAAYEALAERDAVQIRKITVPDKFRLDIVPAKTNPMIYFTQQREPRIVLFGDLELNARTFASAWNGRLMVDTQQTGEGRARVFYQDYSTGESLTEELGRSLRDLIAFFVHDPTPEEPWPGVDLSYSQVVGALHGLAQDEAIDAVIVAENDRLQLDIIRSVQGDDVVARPELSEDGPIASLDALQADREAALATAERTDADRAAREPERDENWEQRRSTYVRPTPRPAPAEGDS